LNLISDFLDRELLGSDAFFSIKTTAFLENRLGLAQSFLAQLSPELAAAVGHENARRIYRLH
jgi:hypothetical protein